MIEIKDDEELLTWLDPDADERDLADTGEEWERAYLSMYEHALWHDDTDRALAGFSESQLPEMVTERLQEAIYSGALFSDIESVPSDRLSALRTEFGDMLESDGWTLNDITDQLQEFEPSLSDARAENIARSETSAIVNTARSEAYEDRGLADDRFRWTGPSDHRETQACEWLKQQTKDGVTLERLKELIEEAPSHDEDMQNDLARPDDYIVHPQERHTFVRVVE